MMVQLSQGDGNFTFAGGRHAAPLWTAAAMLPNRFRNSRFMRLTPVFVTETAGFPATQQGYCSPQSRKIYSTSTHINLVERKFLKNSQGEASARGDWLLCPFSLGGAVPVQSAI